MSGLGARRSRRSGRAGVRWRDSPVLRAYRRPYPTELIEHLRRFGRGGQGRLLDLGCGTGQLLLQLAGFFDHCIGIDSEPDMLNEAARLARERHIGNAEWIQTSSSHLLDLESQLGLADLATIGTAFHFMEPQATLGALMRLVREGGAVAGSLQRLHEMEGCPDRGRGRRDQAVTPGRGGRSGSVWIHSALPMCRSPREPSCLVDRVRLGVEADAVVEEARQLQ